MPSFTMRTKVSVSPAAGAVNVGRETVGSDSHRCARGLEPEIVQRIPS